MHEEVGSGTGPQSWSLHWDKASGAKNYTSDPVRAPGLRSLGAPGERDLWLHRLNHFSTLEFVMFAFRKLFCSKSKKQAVASSPENLSFCSWAQQV